MKKLVLMALLTMGMVGCKEEKAEQATDENQKSPAVTICDESMEGYEAIPEADNVKRAEWLSRNGAVICKQVLYPYILKGHALKDGEFETMRNTYGTQTPLKMKWKSIHESIKEHFYDKYVGFNVSGSKITSIKLVDKFNPEGGTYSIPLFLAIADDLGLEAEDDKTVFEFILTNEKKSPVIFRVMNQAGTEMNYSTKPKNNNNMIPL